MHSGESLLHGAEAAAPLGPLLQRGCDRERHPDPSLHSTSEEMAGSRQGPGMSLHPSHHARESEKERSKLPGITRTSK